jgi:S-DNA-T family DNA segregation ATPase FtsK/SpoIIIE
MPQAKPASRRRTSKQPTAGGAPTKSGSKPKQRAPTTPLPKSPSQQTTWVDDVQLFLKRYGRELLALTAIIVGVLLLLSLRGEEPTWMEQWFGWTAILVALTITAVGVIVLLGSRAGYWSAEALIGVELVLLSLQAGTYVIKSDPSVAYQHADATTGGIVGWAFGGLLLDLVGRWITLIILLLIGLVGLLLLVRYTPLIYLAAGTARTIPALNFWAQRAAVRLRHTGLQPTPSASTAASIRYVPAEPTPSSLPSPTSNPASAIAAGGVSGSTAKPTQPLQNASATSQTSLKQSVAKSAAGRLSKTEAVLSARPDAGSVALPSVELLNKDVGTYTGSDVSQMQRLIESTLEDFNVPVRVVHVETGPTVTQFGVEPLYLEYQGQKRKVRVSRITNLADDLALALAAPAVRIEAPVAGKPYVGIEVPNVTKTTVLLRSIMESPELRHDGGALALPMGRNTSGAPVVMDLTRAPHMLIAGATGSGKSVCINAIIMGLLMRHGPDTLRMAMIDPKRVELTSYNGIPHLLGPVIAEMDRVMPALTWLMLQMDDRYRLFREAGVRNIDGYNALMRSAYDPAKGEAPPLMPYIVLIVDELADLMMTAAEDVERQLVRLAQKSRATGIHLILATQRPSVDVVTGLIKANFPTRVAFAVTSQIDSRVILDTPGAERLLGRGDMLMLRPEHSKLHRIQGCLVGDDEIARVIDFWKDKASPATDAVREPWADLIGREDDADELMQEAIEALRGLQVCSTSMLQRKMRLGYPRAARLMDKLEAAGVVGPDMGAGQGREVLLTDDPPEQPLPYAAAASTPFAGTPD